MPQFNGAGPSGYGNSVNGAGPSSYGNGVNNGAPLPPLLNVLAGRRPQRRLLNSTPQLNDVSPLLTEDELYGVDEVDGNYNGAGPALLLKNFVGGNIDDDDEGYGNYNNGAGVAGNVGNFDGGNDDAADELGDFGVAGNVGNFDGGDVDNNDQLEGVGKRKNVRAVKPVPVPAKGGLFEPVPDPAKGRLFVLSSLLDVVAQFKATAFNKDGQIVESVLVNQICPLWLKIMLESELPEIVAYLIKFKGGLPSSGTVRALIMRALEFGRASNSIRANSETGNPARGVTKFFMEDDVTPREPTADEALQNEAYDNYTLHLHTLMDAQDSTMVTAKAKKQKIEDQKIFGESVRNSATNGLSSEADEDEDDEETFSRSSRGSRKRSDLLDVFAAADVSRTKENEDVAAIMKKADDERREERLDAQERKFQHQTSENEKERVARKLEQDVASTAKKEEFEMDLQSRERIAMAQLKSNAEVSMAQAKANAEMLRISGQQQESMMKLMFKFMSEKKEGFEEEK